tara:strand:+ start:6826 stop:8580 length:1755 start_codon:yes stop_codon:yes gene_type:complete
MAIKRYTASIDNTIVNAYELDLRTRGTGANAGASDVLETFSIYGRVTTSSQELSRILIKFPVTDISTDRTNGVVPASGSVSFYLRMHNAEHSKTVPRDYTISIFTVSQSWQEGVGLDLEDYQDLTLGNEGSNWMSASNTAYWTDVNDTVLAGGSYITGAEPNGVGNNVDSNQEIFIFNKSFSTGIEDLEVDVTPVIEQWIAETYPNHGFGVHLSASYEADHSGTLNGTVSRKPGQLDLGEEDTTQSVIYNPSGSSTSYFTKRFFGRGTEFFFKRPAIEARWNDALKDDRGNFFYSSSLATNEYNLNTIYFYNYVRGQLTDIPALGSDKRIYVSIYSGSVGGFYSNQGGGDGDDVAPSNYPVSGTTSANTGSVQILSVDNPGHVRSVNLLVVTGGIVSTGIYSASFAFTGSELLKTIYDVWFTGSDATTSANDAITQYFTGAVKPTVLRAENRAERPTHYMSVTNLRGKYRANETARFNLYVREKFWNPTVYTVANSTAPATSIISASYSVYRIMDAYGAIPYGTGSDKHTVLSYDVSGNYFDLDMNLLEPGYAYGLKFSFYDSALSTWVEQPDRFRFRVEDYEY